MRTVGIDGGGTNTRFVLYDDKEGLIRRVKIEAPSNYHLVGIEKTKEVFSKGIKDVSKGGNFDALGAGLSGAGRPEDQKIIGNILNDMGIKKHIIANDGITALWGATGGVGILMISGTGSLVIGRNSTGEVNRAGGWGYLIDEYCGGYWFANKAAVAALEYRDGMAEPTELYERLIKFHNLDRIEGLVYLYYKDFDKSEIAAFTREVFAAAENKDKVAISIVNEGLSNAMRMIRAVSEKCGFNDAFDFSYTGGAFNSSYFIERFKCTLSEVFPRATFKAPEAGADIGAALMAMNEYKNYL